MRPVEYKSIHEVPPRVREIIAEKCGAVERVSVWQLDYIEEIGKRFGGGVATGAFMVANIAPVSKVIIIFDKVYKPWGCKPDVIPFSFYETEVIDLTNKYYTEREKAIMKIWKTIVDLM